MENKLISISKASKLLGITQWTLRRYEYSYLPFVTTQGGHRRYKESDVKKLQGTIDEDAYSKNNVIIYCRVSSSDQKQKGDLERQKLRLLEFAISKKYKIEDVFEEVGSGMSDSRIKLRKLCELVFQRKVDKIIIEHKDRLTRFNFRLYEFFFKSCGVEIECVEQSLPKTFEAELVEDMLSLLSSFSAKIYGKRSNKNKIKNEAIKNEN